METRHRNLAEMLSDYHQTWTGARGAASTPMQSSDFVDSGALTGTKSAKSYEQRSSLAGSSSSPSSSATTAATFTPLEAATTASGSQGSGVDDMLTLFTWTSLNHPDEHDIPEPKSNCVTAIKKYIHFSTVCGPLDVVIRGARRLNRPKCSSLMFVESVTIVCPFDVLTELVIQANVGELLQYRRHGAGVLCDGYNDPNLHSVQLHRVAHKFEFKVSKSLYFRGYPLMKHGSVHGDLHVLWNNQIFKIHKSVVQSNETILNECILDGEGRWVWKCNHPHLNEKILKLFILWLHCRWLVPLDDTRLFLSDLQGLYQLGSLYNENVLVALVQRAMTIGKEPRSSGWMYSSLCVA